MCKDDILRKKWQIKLAYSGAYAFGAAFSVRLS